MEAPSMGRRKRALDEEDERRDASSERENVSPRLMDAQVGLPAGGHVAVAGAGADRGRVTGAVKSRRLSQDLGESPAHFVAKLAALSGPVSPALRVLAPFLSDSDAARTPSGGNAPFVSSPFELKKALGRPMFALGGTQSQGRPAISAPLGTPGRAPEQKTSPPAHLRGRTGGPGVSPMGSQEQKSPIRQARPGVRKPAGENPRADRGLPTISHLLGAGGQDINNSPVFGSLTTPYRAPTATSTTAPSSKQVTKRQPFPFAQRRNLEPAKGISTPVLDSGGIPNSVATAPMPSFDSDDVSSDEELMGIPGPDIPDPEISFSQEKLGDLSVTENNLEETVVLTLCDGLANSLTKVERDQMELLNLYTIALAQQPSPIMLGRDQFQDVFGDNIRGGMLSHLSRRHCLVHVENVPSRDDSAKMGVKVRVEDTSTNGIRVNGIQLKNGQSHELELDDIVTLLRIRRDEDDVSLEYKLVRADPPPENNKRMSRKNRHDGRFVRPSDKFSCELLDVSSRRGLSPVQESDVVPPSTAPVRAVAHERRHQIPAGPFTPAEAHFSAKKETGMSKAEPVRQSSILKRRIRCTILFADQSTQDFSESSQPLEDANFDYREELSEVLSTFASIRTFDASSYHCATTESIEDALNDDSDVVFYTGGGDEDHLVVEAPNGLSARLEKNDALHLFSEANHSMPKLIVVISPSIEPECGAPHVCFLSSASKHSLRVTAFIRALFAGLLKGFSIEKSYTLAEFVALNDLLPIVRPADQICKMLPSSKQHSVQIGSPITNAVATDRNVIALLNASFIPVLATHFLGREVLVRKLKAVLAQKARVCNVYGPRGVGKSSIAIHVAKTSYRTRGYRNGVHYFAVDKLVEHIQNGIKPLLTDSQDNDSSRPNNQREDPLRSVIGGVETLLRSLPETDPANYPTALLVLDGCDVVLPALEVFVLNILRSFPDVQILLTSTEKVQVDTDEDEVLLEEAIHVEELGKVDSARLFFKLARGHLTSKQFRQHFLDSSIEAISNDERLLGTKGNPFRISRLVYVLESQTSSG
ncbi:hypothetical protein PHYPSEUDO_009325 [Phytophthora pseudosyringae]|uniref:FHA domain-containing protein n=1 Tax=Phytophthora pseudosyringae TaxID=221518 RepID=A0A8T1VFF7_9STRA|nr:hypothetical protein PHYPSEUDO_009325 [Phytophthora pseudosyringae]